MKNTKYKQNTSTSKVPQTCSKIQKAYWYASQNNWDKAHYIVQFMMTREAAWLHSIIQNEEGDISKFDFRYSMASKMQPSTSIAKN